MLGTAGNISYRLYKISFSLTFIVFDYQKCVCRFYKESLFFERWVNTLALERSKKFSGQQTVKAPVLRFFPCN
jgi:hypothetical protein